MNKSINCVLLVTFSVVGSFPSYAVPIDITEATGGFIVSELSLVSFGPDVNEATLLEDPLFGVTYLSNDPFLSDPGIVVPGDVTTLSFDYHFSTSGSDNFEAAVLDPGGGPVLFSFFFDGIVSSAGIFSGDNISFDLASLGLAGTTIGLEFVLTSNVSDSTTDAVLAISDVRFNQQVSIPEPGLFALMTIGLVSLGRIIYRSKSAH